MSLLRFLLSSVLVSATFALMAYAIAVAVSDEGVDFMRSRGLLYFSLLPYLFGALINKEGYWQRSEGKKKKPELFDHRALRGAVLLLLLGIGTVIYVLWGYQAVKNTTLVMLGLVWGALVARAWFIYEESQAQE